MIRRNPGATAIWMTESYKVFPDGSGRYLIEIGDPSEVTWWREGRPATRGEVLTSMETGLPLLREACDQEKPEERAAAHAEIDRRLVVAFTLLPDGDFEEEDPLARAEFPA